MTPRTASSAEPAPTGAMASLAVGVAIFVAVIAGAGPGAATIAAFHLGWWIMAGVVMLCLVPTLWLIRPVRAMGRA